MDDDKLLLYAGIALGAYVIYKNMFESPLSQSQGAAALENAGLSNVHTTSDGAVYATAGDTTFRFLDGDFSKLNAAQRILIGVDRIIPGDWLTRMVLS